MNESEGRPQEALGGPPATPDEGAAPQEPVAAVPGKLGEISPELHHDPYGEEVLDVSPESFEALLDQHRTVSGDIAEGQIVRARVLRTTDSAVILEFGFKSEGTVALDEFKDPEAVAPGREVEVLLERLEDEDGIVVLSKKKADFLRVWELIREAHEEGRPVKGTLARKIKGGVTVDIMGVDAFLPGSQIALRRVPNIGDLIGETYDFLIIKLNKRRRNIVVSRRLILERDRKKQRSALVKELLAGQVREGVVKNITDFGAFIDLGGLDGLLHITDMSWGRVSHPSQVVEIGSHIDVKVLDVDWDRERISLGLKQLLPYPWTDIEYRYPVGARVRGKVVSITNYGAFVELQEGVEGLVHISEMSWTRNVRHPSKLVVVGDEVEVVVLKVDPSVEKISLGMKQIEADPWLALPLQYPAGTNLAGTVRNLTTFGAFVEIEPGIDGLVHVSDMSWTRRVEHPSEVVVKGERVEVTVLEVDADNKRISLGIKQLQEDPWPALVMRYAKDTEVEGQVSRIQDKGLVVDLGEGVEGFVPGSHSGVSAGALEDHYEAGLELSLRVISSDVGERRIVLEVLEVPERTRGGEVDGEADSETGGPDGSGEPVDDGEADGGREESTETEGPDDADHGRDEPTGSDDGAESAEETDAPEESAEVEGDDAALADEPSDAESAAEDPADSSDRAKSDQRTEP